MSGFFRHALLPFLGNAAYLTINHKPIFGLVLEEAFSVHESRYKQVCGNFRYMFISGLVVIRDLCVYL